MNKQNSKTYLVIFLFLLTALFMILRFSGDGITNSLFQNNQHEILNFFTGVSENQPLDFYLGRSQETVWGPLTQLLAVTFLIILSLHYLKFASFGQYGLAIILYLLVTKFEILFFPPYGDAVGGPLAEALWLSRNSFDYMRLYNEAGYAWGGPKVYMFSVYPTLQAVLMKWLPPKVYFFVNHLTIIIMVAAMASVFRSILKKLYNEEIAVLLPALLISLPLFQSQTEAINMEMPCAFFILLSVYYLVNQRIHLASVMSICAILVKGTAVFASAALVFIYLCYFIGKTQYRFHFKFIIWAIVLSGISVLKILSKFLIDDQHVSQGMVKMFAGWPSLYTMVIFYLFCLCLLLAGIFFFWNHKSQNAHNDMTCRVLRSPIHWFMFIFAGSWFALFLNFYAVSPRYRVLVYPFIVYCVFSGVSFLIKSPKIQKWLIIVAIGISAVSAFGLFYTPMMENDHVLLERSLEYRNDLKLNQKVLKRLEGKYHQFTIGAPFVIAQMLTFPEFGYIKDDLDIMIYGFNCTYGGIKEFPGIKELNVGRTIYVGVKVVELDENLSYPIAPHDRIIETIQYGNKKAWLFMGGVALDSILRATRKMLLENVTDMLR